MKKSCAIIFILLFFITQNSIAQNINDVLRLAVPGLGSNARALGMGNSYISLSDDASAAFFNPAGFGLLKRLEFSGGIDYTNFKNKAVFFGEPIEYSNSNTKLDRLSFAFPFPTIRGSLVFGLTYHTTKDLTGALSFDGYNPNPNSRIQSLDPQFIPYDLYLTDNDYNTPINGGLSQYGDILSSGAIRNWTFSAAMEVYKNLFVGANLNIHSGNFESSNDYYEEDTKNIYQGLTAAGEERTRDFELFYLSNIIDWDLSGWSAKFGILYQFQKFARFGATIQFPQTFNINEKFLVDGRSEFGTGFVQYLDRDFYSDEVEYDIVTPFMLGFGLSGNFLGLIISTEATLVDYSQTEFDNPGEGLSDKAIQDKNKEIKDQLRSVVNYNLGLEYTIPFIGIRVRGGYMVQPSAYKGDASSFDRKYITGGIGFLADETIGLDLAYAYGWWDDLGDNYGSNVSRTFQEIKVDNFVFTATYRF